VNLLPNLDKIPAGYLYAFLASPLGISIIKGGIYGTSVKHIEPSHIVDLPVPRGDADDEALGLFVVLMQLFAEAQNDGRRFNKLVVFDEAHKYIESPDLVAGLVESVREMRHKGMSVLVASQDPPSVPISLIELSNHVILHKFTSPAWLKHLQKANASLADLTSSHSQLTARRVGTTREIT